MTIKSGVMTGKRKENRREIPSAVHHGQEYKPDDCVLINPDHDAPAYVSAVRPHLVANAVF